MFWASALGAHCCSLWSAGAQYRRCCSDRVAHDSFSSLNLRCEIPSLMANTLPLLWKLIHTNSWLIIKGPAISIQSPSRGCHGSEGRNLLRATGEPNWICGVSVYECVSTSSVHRDTMCWRAAGKSSCTSYWPRAGLGGSMQALKPARWSWFCCTSWGLSCLLQVFTFTKKKGSTQFTF